MARYLIVVTNYSPTFSRLEERWEDKSGGLHNVDASTTGSFLATYSGIEDLNEEGIAGVIVDEGTSGASEFAGEVLPQKPRLATGSARTLQEFLQEAKKQSTI